MKLIHTQTINYGYSKDNKGGVIETLIYFIGILIKRKVYIDYTIVSNEEFTRIPIKGFKTNMNINNTLPAPHIIGIMGKKQSGKNTIAAMLKWLQFTQGIYPEGIEDNTVDFEAINIIKSKWEIKAFATRLKLIVSILTGCTLFDLEQEEFKNSLVPNFIKGFIMHNNKNKNKPITYRTLLQCLGTDIFRKYCPNIWVDCLLSSKNKDTFWLISDVRFMNEIEAIKTIDPNSIIIKVERENNNQEQPEHSSENLEGLPFDILINNNGTLKELYNQLKELKLNL